MKDPLKKHIERTRADFDVYQTDYNLVWDQISEQLDRGNAPRRRIFKSVLKVAASIVIIISIGISYYLGKKSVEFNREGIALHNLSSELAETEAYYVTLIDDQMQFIKKNKSQLSSDTWLSIEQLDKDYDQLKKDLTERADSQEVIDAMINFYRLKLNMLEQISDELKEKQAENEHSNI